MCSNPSHLCPQVCVHLFLVSSLGWRSTCLSYHYLGRLPQKLELATTLPGSLHAHRGCRGSPVERKEHCQANLTTPRTVYTNRPPPLHCNISSTLVHALLHYCARKSKLPLPAGWVRVRKTLLVQTVCVAAVCFLLQIFGSHRQSRSLLKIS